MEIREWIECEAIFEPSYTILCFHYGTACLFDVVSKELISYEDKRYIDKIMRHKASHSYEDITEIEKLDGRNTPPYIPTMLQFRWEPIYYLNEEFFEDGLTKKINVKFFCRFTKKTITSFSSLFDDYNSKINISTYPSPETLPEIHDMCERICQQKINNPMRRIFNK